MLNTQKNKKLATHLSTLASQQKASALAAYEHDSLLLPSNSSSRLQTENDLERTWKVSQDEIRQAVGAATAQKAFSLNLTDSGPYELDYSVDGRSLAIAGRRGHVATFDWQTGKLGIEMHLNETVRDIWCVSKNASSPAWKSVLIVLLNQLAAQYFILRRGAEEICIYLRFQRPGNTPITKPY